MQRPPLFGTASVVTANTAVPLYSDAGLPAAGVLPTKAIKQVSKLYIQADPANTAAVVIGNAAGQKWSLSATGFPLSLEAADNDFFNLFDFFVNSGTNTQKVNFIAIECMR